MGTHANTPRGKILLWAIAGVVIVLNLILLWNTFQS
jgi:Mn2+/Fe2+ NRAMP family transporter